MSVQPQITVMSKENDIQRDPLPTSWWVTIGGDSTDNPYLTVLIWNNRGGTNGSSVPDLNYPVLYHTKYHTYTKTEGWIKAKLGNKEDNGSYTVLTTTSGLSLGNKLSGIINDGTIEDSDTHLAVNTDNYKKVTFFIDPPESDTGTYDFYIELRGWYI